MECKYTEEQVKAAYALNLCTVSISQIVDYDDINIMEQEYEGILNNLNIEQMPKDEALLKIIKQILDTITFFRIQEGDKKFIEKKYQQKMKNAIWAAVPNIALVVAGGNPVTTAISLASQVGMGYMNYRKAKADADLDQEMEVWQLERTAIEQFNGLRRELFDTAWRLSAAYNFPDQFRLTERQIKQYNEILMDTDLIRRYERLNTIQDAFIAYPPFWYYFGNTANEIAGSGLRISESTRQEYREKAKSHFLQYRNSNQYGLLREDPVSASCALELVDLLDIEKDAGLIHQLLQEAIRFSGRANDVLQLAAFSYLRLNDQTEAAKLFSQLVNEQYNTTLNAQLLSSIYVSRFSRNPDPRIRAQYEILSNQVGEYYLYPLPDGDQGEDLNDRFLMSQKQVLHQKYRLALGAFLEKYNARFMSLLPNEDGRRRETEPESMALSNRDIRFQWQNIFSDRRRAEAYKEILRNSGYFCGIFDLLNQLFDACCRLDFVTEPVRDSLYRSIENAVHEQREQLNQLRSRLEDDTFNYFDMEKILGIGLKDFTRDFLKKLTGEINSYIMSRTEMLDFAIAEQNLSEFCSGENLPEPNIAADRENHAAADAAGRAERKRFTLKLLEDSTEPEMDSASKTQNMSDLIAESAAGILLRDDCTEMYFGKDARIERYFRSNGKLRKNNQLMAGTLAVIDNKTAKFDFDLILTEYGIVPIKSGSAKAPVAYDKVDWGTGKTKNLAIDGHYEAEGVDLEALLELFHTLAPMAKPLPQGNSPFVLPDMKLPFGKK